MCASVGYLGAGEIGDCLHRPPSLHRNTHRSIRTRTGRQLQPTRHLPPSSFH